MPKATPQRIQLSRAKGFDLQSVSKALNGLPAVNCARPSRWGNPFLINPHHAAGQKWYGNTISVPTAEDAVECYRIMLEEKCVTPDSRAAQLKAALPELRGKNLACWCRPGEPCHVDVLLKIANAPEAYP